MHAVYYITTKVVVVAYRNTELSSWLDIYGISTRGAFVRPFVAQVGRTCAFCLSLGGERVVGAENAAAAVRCIGCCVFRSVLMDGGWE